ncbi:hypothetical protein P171DRAFT_487006 [Karstenula rhodostoma CBS 690.94]|uniref:Uncharacterized protein n=1 Tax=Karstenula rhodostoma CBS 690.94 TaxID=1392251 RepID=A0A9P4PHK9_9PLEO|nr:hypothetical protein P171DRAFT_487006 [Karstenula rhodostoma CBS 690.94]
MGNALDMAQGSDSFTSWDLKGTNITNTRSTDEHTTNPHCLNVAPTLNTDTSQPTADRFSNGQLHIGPLRIPANPCVKTFLYVNATTFPEDWSHLPAETERFGPFSDNVWYKVMSSERRRVSWKGYNPTTFKTSTAMVGLSQAAQLELEPSTPNLSGHGHTTRITLAVALLSRNWIIPKTVVQVSALASARPDKSADGNLSGPDK